MSPERFAAILAQRLQEIVPPGFRVWSEGLMLYFSQEAGKGYYGGTSGTYAVDYFFGRDGDVYIAEEGLVDSEEQRAVLAALKALDELRDHVDDESIGPSPWRGVVPCAEVQGANLKMWFEIDGDPVLEATAINLYPDDESAGAG